MEEGKDQGLYKVGNIIGSHCPLKPEPKGYVLRVRGSKVTFACSQPQQGVIRKVNSIQNSAGMWEAYLRHSSRNPALQGSVAQVGGPTALSFRSKVISDW